MEEQSQNINLLHNIPPCKNCQTINWGEWTSSTTGKIKRYCKTCRKSRAKKYGIQKKDAVGSHSAKEWLSKLAQYDECPNCERLWVNIPRRPNQRYKYVWTKDHITPLSHGGSDDIGNIQPLCYQCNFGKR